MYSFSLLQEPNAQQQYCWDVTSSIVGIIRHERLLHMTVAVRLHASLHVLSAFSINRAAGCIYAESSTAVQQTYLLDHVL